MSLRIYKCQDGRWELVRRTWDGIDKPDYDHIRYLKFEEAADLVKSGEARDPHGAVAAALKNPLVEIAQAADEGPGVGRER